MNKKNICREIIKYSKLLYEREYCVASEGNISFRLGTDKILITPTKVLKAFITEKDLVEIDMKGNQTGGICKPTTERFTHLEIYRQNPDIKAVVHAHPFYTVLSTVLGTDPLDKIFLSEAAMFLKDVCFAPFAKPSTTEGSEAVRNLCAGKNAIVIDRHGSFTCGNDLQSAFSILEVLEKYCKMAYYAGLSGKQIRYIDDSVVEELKKICY